MFCANYGTALKSEDICATQENAWRTVSGFLSAKIKQLSAAAAQKCHERNMFKEPDEDGSIIACPAIIKQLRCESSIVREELHALRKQRRAIEQDLNESLALDPDIDTAYTQLMISKITAARGKAHHATFKRTVVEYYGAGRVKKQTHEQNYCQVFGWMPEGVVKAVPIVPRSLAGLGLDRLFGVKDTLLADPRNGLLLHKVLGDFWNEGKIIIVPVIQRLGSEAEWKVVVTDEKWWNADVIAGSKLKHIDGQFLRFPNARPAQRFLYFRFFLSWLQCRNEEWIGWDEEVFCGGLLGAPHGRYMRRSMVKAIASHVLDHYIYGLPSGIIDINTFDDDDDDGYRCGEDAISMEEEAELADELSLLIEHFHAQTSTPDTSDEDHDEITDDETPYFDPSHPARYSLKVFQGKTSSSSSSRKRRCTKVPRSGDAKIPLEKKGVFVIG
ncbi:hypothetical protein B7494_g1996 [Chlorociboria aeruginascens]|nr:hypothetical protein B7494_g1996 [Chlorociboria aeruginascens]